MLITQIFTNYEIKWQKQKYRQWRHPFYRSGFVNIRGFRLDDGFGCHAAVLVPSPRQVQPGRGRGVIDGGLRGQDRGQPVGMLGGWGEVTSVHPRAWSLGYLDHSRIGQLSLDIYHFVVNIVNMSIVLIIAAFSITPTWKCDSWTIRNYQEKTTTNLGIYCEILTESLVGKQRDFSHWWCPSCPRVAAPLQLLHLKDHHHPPGQCCNWRRCSTSPSTAGPSSAWTA